MVEGPAPGRESVIAIDEQDRENVVADGLKTSHADKGNRRGNKSVFLGAFPNEINSLGRRFVSHQPPHPSISSGSVADRNYRQINDLVGRLSQEGTCRLTAAHVDKQMAFVVPFGVISPIFTDKQCKNAFCPEGKARARVTDAGGLYLEIAGAGSKRWFWKYYFDSKEKRLF